MKRNLPTSIVIGVMALLISISSANAALIVDPGKITAGSATGTLVVIDVPFVDVFPTTGGPAWPEAADNGFATVNDTIGISDGTSNWEPDGTPLAEALGQFTFGNGPVPSVTWNFNLADSGIDIPDGAVINAVYATFNTRGSDGITWEYTEGAASDSFVHRQNVAPLADLVLNWTDSVGGTHDGNFERIFSTPISVEGGDGFQLFGTDNIQNAAHVDAIVLDVTLPGGGVPEPATATLAMLGLGGLVMRRRRNAA